MSMDELYSDDASIFLSGDWTCTVVKHEWREYVNLKRQMITVVAANNNRVVACKRK